MSNLFIKFPKHILYADGFFSADGEKLPLSVYDKIIYAYMLDKQQQFARDKGMVHFESQSTIARYTRLSRKTINITLGKFIDAGVIRASKVPNKAGGLPHWQYTGVKHPLPTWVQDEDGNTRQINKTMCETLQQPVTMDEGLDLPWDYPKE